VAATGDAEAFELAGEVLRGMLLALLSVEGDDVRVVRKALQDSVSFFGEDLFAGESV
jgi:hypothetical protein